ncbi:MAG: AAA family ATPase [Bacteroidota bacterium]
MSKIRIKNFGPIKEGFKESLPNGTINEWMDIKKVTMFIGNQGSGKSTVAKLISTFSWMEKALLNGTLDSITENSTQQFIEERCGYLRLEKYFKPNSEIFYRGDYFDIEFEKGFLNCEEKKSNDLYNIPKIMYVPAERSFLSSVEDTDSISGLPRSLDTFRFENNRSLKALGDVLKLPFGSYQLRYDHSKRTSYIQGDDYELELSAASSGLHSAVPLYIVSRDLANVIATRKTDNSISALNYKQQIKKNAELQELRVGADDVLSNEHLDEFKKQEQIIESKYRNSSFLNIVEEPEQNLYPSSQRSILNSLIEYNNITNGNKLVMTTHSPYLINYLTLAVKAYQISKELKYELLKEKLAAIVPPKSMVNPDDLAIYELDEKEGKIIKLADYYGIPSDENYLNQVLANSNLLYDALLEIEEDNES